MENSVIITYFIVNDNCNHRNIFRLVKNSDSLGNHLNSLLEDALNKINDFTFGSVDDLGENYVDKQIDFWQRRANSLQRILRGWVQTSTPYLPTSVIVDVTSTNSVSVKVQESHSGAITTKFKSKLLLYTFGINCEKIEHQCLQ